MNCSHTINKKRILQHSIFFAAFIPAVIFIFWKCRYGFANLDEAFYMTIPYKLLQGDALFVNEWHPSQLTSFIIYPFLAIFARITGGVEGAILMSRYVCATLLTLSGLLIYFRLKRFHWLGAAAASLCYTLFIPYNIMAMSYNNLGIIMLTSSLVIFLSAQNHLKLQYYVSGILFALAVLCNPYLLFVYLIYILMVAGSKAFKRTKSIDVLSWKTALFISLGAASMAVVFFIFLLSRSSVAELIKSVPMIFTDPEHGNAGFFYTLYLFICNPMIQVARHIMVPAYFILFGLMAVCFFDRNRYKRKLLYYVPALIILIQIVVLTSKINYINQLMWAINFSAPFIFLLSENKKTLRLFAMLWVPGMLFSFLTNMSSNLVFFAFSAAATVAVVASIVMMCMFASEILSGLHIHVLKSGVCLVTAFLVLFQIGSVAHLRYTHIYWDTVIGEQHILMEEGFNKGIYVSDHKYKLYNDLKANLAVLDNYEIENILFLSEQTWYYLESPYRSSSFCSILSGINEHTIERLQQYYELCPDRMPDAVFVEKASADNCVYPDADYAAVADLFCQTFNYSADDYENCWVLTPAN